MTSKNKHIAKTALSVHRLRRSPHCSIHVCSTRISQNSHNINIKMFPRHLPPAGDRFWAPLPSVPPVPSASPQPPLIYIFFLEPHTIEFTRLKSEKREASLVTGRNFLVSWNTRRVVEVRACVKTKNKRVTMGCCGVAARAPRASATSSS